MDKKIVNPSELANATPSGGTPYLVTPALQKNLISDKTLSGTAFLILNSISIILHPPHNYKAFECSSVTLKLPSSILTVFNIYRPPTSSKYA